MMLCGSQSWVAFYQVSVLSTVPLPHRGTQDSVRPRKSYTHELGKVTYDEDMEILYKTNQ